MRSSDYLIVVEPTRTGFSAFSPDIPGCIATGRTELEVQTRIAGAIEFHLNGLRVEGESLPSPGSFSAYASVPTFPDKPSASVEGTRTEEGVEVVTSYHVVPKDHGWTVKGGGTPKDSRVFSRKDAAVKHARSIVSKRGAKVVVHRKDGTVQSATRVRSSAKKP